MDVIVTNLQGISVDSKFVHDVVVQALRLQGYHEPPDVGVALVDDAYIRVLNREYRGGDYATDVLSFRLDDGDGAFDRGGTPAPALGDIVISIQRAREQARQFKQPLRREIALLTIHGVLHLLGYDDETEAAAAVMWARQKELLAAILGGAAAAPVPHAAAAGRRSARRSR